METSKSGPFGVSTMSSYRERAGSEFDTVAGQRPSNVGPLWFRHLDEWRRAAEDVRRAWKAWLAADRSRRRARFSDYLAALAAEEAAARVLERDARFRRRRRRRA